jgi:hypothetical protein
LLTHLSSFERCQCRATGSLYWFAISQAVDLDGALHDLEVLRAEVERKDIELDQALQDHKSSVPSLETQVKSLQEELANVKEDRNTFGKFVAMLLDESDSPGNSDDTIQVLHSLPQQRLAALTAAKPSCRRASDNQVPTTQTSAMMATRPILADGRDDTYTT